MHAVACFTSWIAYYSTLLHSLHLQLDYSSAAALKHTVPSGIMLECDHGVLLLKHALRANNVWSSSTFSCIGGLSSPVQLGRPSPVQTRREREADVLEKAKTGDSLLAWLAAVVCFIVLHT